MNKTQGKHKQSDLCIGINGFGRIGRLLLRNIVMKKMYSVAAINDPCLDAETAAYLLKYDSVHGKFPMDVNVEGKDCLNVSGCKIKMFQCSNPEDIPWGDMGVQIVAETSGKNTSCDKCQGHLKSGARMVVLSAPPKDQSTPVFVMGVNHMRMKDGGNRVISNASCTTNCAAPLAKLMNEMYGIQEAFLTTVHAMTASQTVVDGVSHKDWRAGRAAGVNIIPSTTGASEAVVKVLPELDGKIAGMAFRVPVEDVSVIDFTMKLSRPMNNMRDLFQRIEQIQNDPNHEMHGVIGVTNEPLVSSDFICEERSCVLDAQACMQVNPTFVKLVAWYDNEWGYACKMAEMMQFAHDCTNSKK